MRVTVRLFAMLRERAGSGEMVLDLPEGARVSDALDRLGDIAEGLPLVMAVNREYAPAEQVYSAPQLPSRQVLKPLFCEVRYIQDAVSVHSLWVVLI